jgi:hypothetical protein
VGFFFGAPAEFHCAPYFFASLLCGIWEEGVVKKRLIALIATAALTTPVLADYVANFDTSGSATDFTTVRTANSDGQTVTPIDDRNADRKYERRRLHR